MSTRFRIDEEGFIKLLRRDIYSRDDVHIRELLQNAIDARATHIDICMHVIDVSNDVVALSCCDNGLGMTKAGIVDQFLNLCKRHSPGENNLFRRFGIGVFTYLAFCREIHVSTRSKGGKAWDLKILGKETIQSLDDISVGDLAESDREHVGTSILLVLNQKAEPPRIVSSLQYWIRDQLPATVDVFTSPMISLQAKNLSLRLGRSKEAALQRYDVTPQNYPSAAHVLGDIPTVKSGFLQIGSYPEGVAVCEGGMLIEDGVSEFTPRDMSDIPFSGIINVTPGLLDLDAGRSRVRRESVGFARLRHRLASSFSAALAAHIKRRSHRLTDNNFKEARIVRQALRSASDPSKLLKECEDSLFFHVLGHGELSLKRMAIKSRNAAIYSYSGDLWYWILSMGDLKGHDTKLHVTMRSNAGMVSSGGNVVFILPEEKADGKIIDENALETYFRRFYGTRLLSIGSSISPTPRGMRFPDYWRSKVSIPNNLSIAATTVPGTLFFDSRGNALLSKDDRVVCAIDSYLREAEEVPAATKRMIESYLNLMSGKVSGASSKIEAAVMSAVRPEPKTRRTTIKEVIDEIER